VAKSTLFYTHDKLESDNINDFLNLYTLVPNAFGHQKNNPEACCRERIIGDFELIYVIGGESFINVNGQEYECEAGDVILIPPFIKHSITTTMEHPHNNFWLHFDVVPFYLYKDFFSALSPDGGYRIKAVNSTKLKSLYNILEEEYEAKKQGYRVYFKNVLVMIVCEILRHNYSLSDKVYLHLKKDCRRSYEQDIVDKGIQFISSNIEKKIMIKDLSTNLHMSESYIYKAFINITGISPNNFIQFMRIKEAEKLIKTSDLTFKEISELLGFSSPFYFSKVYKKYYGTSPREYEELYIK
jgi:AraC family transcriptional regulator, arabinose operon regulatory protein